MVFSSELHWPNLIFISRSGRKIEPTVPLKLNFTSAHDLLTASAIFSPSSSVIVLSSIPGPPKIIAGSIPLPPIFTFIFLYSMPERQVATIIVSVSTKKALNNRSKPFLSTYLCRSSRNNIRERQNFQFLGIKKVSRSMSSHLGIITIMGFAQPFKSLICCSCLPCQWRTTYKYVFSILHFR